ncbi:hypothetical protein Corgl_0379 [Coriobacterium glomerans PW2]|uniref:Lipoprotein n=1 Tax=Coriobacterium glomerans (strain ATCC 49209 / DSM 20642 / JCM 10262 / PW2) TaxID=700015 RepID=F2NAH1_CORGP|nr:hypothetical protein [Coriobacterium glomerans]AEB06498.1 hypothetical protein Corgl_0379 [Coriobacterium glomerans PW2]
MSKRRPRQARHLICLIAALVTIAACYMVGMRVSQVNTAVTQHRVHTHELLDPVALVGGPQAATEAVDGVTLTALGCALADQNEMGKLLPGYRDGMITAGAASDVKFLLVRLRLVNGSDENRTPDLNSLAVQEGAWHNGIDPDPAIFRAMNPQASTLELQPGQSKEVLAVFEAYDTQFGFKTAAWDGFGGRGLELVLATYPDKVCITLGRPGILAELESAGGKGENQ